MLLFPGAAVMLACGSGRRGELRRMEQIHTRSPVILKSMPILLRKTHPSRHTRVLHGCTRLATIYTTHRAAIFRKAKYAVQLDGTIIAKRPPFISSTSTPATIGSCTMRTGSPSRARACARPPPSAPDLTSNRTHELMKPSTGAAVRLHRNAVRDRPDSLSAFKWNACPPSPDFAT